MRTRTAKILRMLTLVCWTILAIGLLVMIQKAANTIELQKSVSSIFVVYACLSPAVCGLVVYLTKIIKSSDDSKRK